MSVQDNFHSQHEYLAYFAEFPNIRFTAVSGGDLQTEGNKVFPGGSQTPRNVDGPTQVTDVTISKPAEDVVDAPLRAWANAWKNGARVQLTLVVLRVDSTGLPLPGAPARTYLRCSHRTLTSPTVERGGATVATLQLVVAPEDRTG